MGTRLLTCFLLLLGGRLCAAEVIPPAPAKYFNDYAQVVTPDTAARLNTTLEEFERESSDQILVAIFPKMQSDSSIEDYTVRVARAWRAGQKDKNNGAVLFVFVQDHKIYLQVGYGLEGVLPDALCKRIIAEQITPHFKSGDFSAGLTAGVQGILAAVKGEYQGTGRTVAEGGGQGGRQGISLGFILFFMPFILILIVLGRLRRGFRPGGRGWIITGGGGGWSSGGGGFGGGGGGFSGGGGSFGGGGAGGSW